MKTLLATVLLVSAGCGYVDGVCWRRDEEGQGDGAGGGPILPGGVGGYGAVEPEPQSLGPDGDMPVECWTEACHDKCDRLREEDQHACKKIPAEKQDACRQRATQRAAECRNECQRASTCRKECEAQAEACEEECRKLPKEDKAARRKCWKGCNDAYAECIKKCKD